MRKLLIKLVKLVDNDVCWFTPIKYVTYWPVRILVCTLTARPTWEATAEDANEEIDRQWLWSMGQL